MTVLLSDKSAYCLLQLNRSVIIDIDHYESLPWILKIKWKDNVSIYDNKESIYSSYNSMLTESMDQFRHYLGFNIRKTFLSDSISLINQDNEHQV